MATGELPAGFWVRLAAAIIDLMILAVPFAVFISFLSIGMGISPAFLDLRPGETPNEILQQFGPRFLFISWSFFAVSSWLYFALLEHSKWRATLGKRLLGLQVADEAGERVSLWRASLRFGSGRLMLHVPVIGVWYFLVDSACIGVWPGKRAIHDLVAGCVVRRETDGSPLFGRSKD
jgi:uncharacterized RDD family membrane protein YckC